MSKIAGKALKRVSPEVYEIWNPVEYTGMWPFRKHKKMTPEDVVQELKDHLDSCLEGLAETIEELKEELHKSMKNMNATLTEAISSSDASLGHIQERTAFLEGTINKLIDVSSSMPKRRARDEDEDDKKTSVSTSSSASYADKERARKLKERLLAKRKSEGGNGYDVIDAKAND